MIIFYTLPLVVLLAIILMLGIHLLDRLFIGHDFATTALAAKTVGKIIEDYHKENGRLIDFGSSRGAFIFRLLKQCPRIKAVGIDSSPLRIWFSKILGFLFLRRVVFLKGDIFSADVSTADVVYVYLKPSVMQQVQNKLKKELKSGAMVILNTQTLPSWQLNRSYITHPKYPEYEKLFIYLQP